MQDDTARVVQVAIAFALPSLVQLLYALRGPLRSLLHWTKKDEAVTVRSRQLDWFQFYLWLVCFFVEIPVAAAFLAKAGNHPSAPVLFEVWRGVSLLAAEISVIAIVLYELYGRLSDQKCGRLLTMLWRSWVLVMVHQILQFSLGMRSLLLHGPEFIWSTPISLYSFTVIVAVAILYRGRRTILQKRSHVLRFVIWIAFNVGAVVVTIVAAASGWETQHLIQCLLCVILIFEFLVVKPLIRRISKKLGRAKSEHSSATNPGGWSLGHSSSEAIIVADGTV